MTYRQYLEPEFNGTALQAIAEKIEAEIIGKQNCCNDAFLGAYDSEIERLEAELIKIEANPFIAGTNQYK